MKEEPKPRLACCKQSEEIALKEGPGAGLVHSRALCLEWALGFCVCSGVCLFVAFIVFA